MKAIMPQQASATRLCRQALCGWIVLTLCALLLTSGCRKTPQQTKPTTSAATDVSDSAVPMESMHPPADASASDDGTLVNTLNIGAIQAASISVRYEL
jgi:hypothetical protein